MKFTDEFKPRTSCFIASGLAFFMGGAFATLSLWPTHGQGDPITNGVITGAGMSMAIYFFVEAGIALMHGFRSGAVSWKPGDERGIIPRTDVPARKRSEGGL